MRLNELTLENYCVYEGRQTINLRPDLRFGKHRPIVLFGGMNGGGKTTILDAIQLVLYGKLATCSKKNEKSYDQFLRESINRGVSPAQGALIRLSFDYASDGEQNTYEIERRWLVKSGKVKERVLVEKNGEIDRWLSENWAQQVEDLLPQGISQLCFFDAEKIRFLAEDETSNAALGNAIKSLLGLDLAERLIADSLVLESRIAKRARAVTEKESLDHLENALAAKDAEIARIVQDQGSLANQLEAAHRRVSDAEKSFQSIGGKHWANRDRRQKELATAEGKLALANDQLAELAESELPLALLVKMISSLNERVSKSRRAKEALLVLELLKKRDEAILKKLKRQKLAASSISMIENCLRADLESRSVSLDDSGAPELSTTGTALLNKLYGELLPRKRDAAASLLSTVRKLVHDIEDAHRALANTPNEDAVKLSAEKLKRASQEYAILEDQKRKLDEALIVERANREKLGEQSRRLFDKIAQEMNANDEDSRLLKLLTRTQDTMRVFLQKATEKKIGRLADMVTESFRFLLRKKSLVDRVVIDPTTFDIELEDASGQRISKQQLSEGEKQIFAISVLWGLSRASTRPLPAVIDTPMGRLDAEHRNALLDRYFPNASHQVVILSTDTEIEESAFHKLHPNIARAYHLDYHDERKSTTATEGYFWESAST